MAINAARKPMSFAVLIAGALLVAPANVLGQPGEGPPREGGPGMKSSTLGPECDETGFDADYSETLSGSGTSMERNTVSLTGCPNHVNWAINPNSATENPTDTIIPAYPMLFGDSGTTDLADSEGAVGIMFNGVSMYSSWARDTADSYENAAFYLEGDTFDLCGGHASPDGNYHYHNTAGCLQEQAMIAAGTTVDEHSPQIGWAYDGFPVYGQLGPDGIEMLLCGNDGADDTYCLDSCSGYEGEVDQDDFLYRYYTSCGFDEVFFPFTTNCYRGCCPDGITCDSHVEVCDDDAVVGYIESTYTPEAMTSMDEQFDAELIAGVDSEYINSTVYIDCSLYLGSADASSPASIDDSSSVGKPTPELAAGVWSWLVSGATLLLGVVML